MTDTSKLITSYASLQTAMGLWLNRTDLAALLPVFIQQCESRMKRVIKTKHQDLVTLSVGAGDASVALPTALISVASIAITSPSNFAGELESTTYADLQDDLRMRVVEGCPVKCAIVNETVYLSPIADGSYTLVAQVEGPFVPLSDSAPSNWLLDAYPDVYLYGALAESAPYLQDDERVPIWEGRYQTAVHELEIAAERSQWAAAPTMRVPTNFLTLPQSPQR